MEKYKENNVNKFLIEMNIYTTNYDNNKRL